MGDEHSLLAHVLAPCWMPPIEPMGQPSWWSSSTGPEHEDRHGAKLGGGREELFVATVWRLLHAPHLESSESTTGTTCVEISARFGVPLPSKPHDDYLITQSFLLTSCSFCTEGRRVPQPTGKEAKGKSHPNSVQALGKLSLSVAVCSMGVTAVG